MNEETGPPEDGSSPAEIPSFVALEEPAPSRPPASFLDRHPKVRASGIASLFLVAYVAVEVLLGLTFRPWIERLARFLPLEGDRLLLSRAASLPFVLAYVLLFARWIGRVKPARYGLSWPRGAERGGAIARQAVGATLGTLAFLTLWLAFAMAGGRLEIFGWSPAVAPGGFEARDLGALVLLFGAFFVQGGLEELVLRGGFYGSLRQALSPLSAAVVSSTLFALAHATNPGFTLPAFANTLLAGVLLCALFERTGSLWAPTWVHGVWNFAIGGLLSLPVSGIEIFRLLDARLVGPEGWTGGTYGPEGSWALVPMIAGCIVAIALLPRTGSSQGKGGPETGPPFRDDEGSGV